MGSSAIVYSPVLLPWSVDAPTLGADDSYTSTDSGGGTDGGITTATTASEYYDLYSAAMSLVDHTGGGTDITVNIADLEDDGAPLQTYAVNGGALSFYSATSGKKLPNKETVAVDTVVIEITPNEYQAIKGKFPSGVLVPKIWAYEGLDLDAFKARLKAWSEASPADMARLKAALPPATADLTDAMNYYNRVLEGNWAPIVPAGVHLGEIGAGDGSGVFTLRLRAFDMAGDEIESPAPVLAALDEIDKQLAGHPVMDAAANVQAATEIHLKFRYFKPAATGSSPKGTWEWLKGATVEIMDANSVTSDSVLATGTTSSDTGKEGTVDFTVERPLIDGNDFYFRVTPAAAIQRQYGWTTAELGADAEWTGQWSTQGWNDINGQPGYYENFAGFTIGRPSAPLVFNVGIPIFLKLEYYNKNDSKYRQVGKGTEVAVLRDQTTGETVGAYLADDSTYYTKADTFYADADGEVWGTTFDMYGGYRASVAYMMKIKDPGISLPETEVIYPDIWKSWSDPSNGVYYPDGFNGPAIGDASGAKLQPVRISSKYDRWAAAHFVLKTIRDVHHWFHTLSKGGWTGASNLRIGLQDLAHLSSVTPPDLGILYSDPHYWDRATIAHEYTHEVMWNYINYSWWGLLWDSAVGDYFTSHYYTYITNEESAFMDGWAEIAELAFGKTVSWTAPSGSPMPSYGSTGYGNPLVYSTAHTWGALSAVSLQGVKCEGAFAQAMWDYMHYVLGIDVTPDSDVADLTSVNITIASATAQDGFVKAIWTPLTDLANRSLWASSSVVTISDFLKRSKANMSTADYNTMKTNVLIPWNLV